MMTYHRFSCSLRTGALALALPLLLAACGGGGSDSPAPQPPIPAPPAASPVTLKATAAASELLVGRTTTLSATASDGGVITWQLAAGAPGMLSASSGASVVYTAPAGGVAVPTAVSVTASSGAVSQAVQLVVNPDPGNAGLTLVAGSLGSHTTVDGDAATARFANITDVAPAANGGWLVIDQRYTALRRVSATGNVTTLTANHSGIFEFGRFIGVAARADGSAWVIQERLPAALLRKISADGSIVTVGAPMTELLDTRRLLASAADDLYALVASRDQSSIYRISSAGTPTLLAGLPDFAYATDMARLPNGDLYVVNGGPTVRRVRSGGEVTTVTLTDSATGGALPTTAMLVSITARTDGSLALLVQDTQRYTVYGMTVDGTLTALASGARIAPAGPAGTRRTDFATLRAAPGNGLLLANQGELHTLLPGSAPTRLTGLEDDSLADVDGIGGAARFIDPMFIASDGRGTIHVADHPTGYGTGIGFFDDHGLYLRRIDAAGKVTSTVSNADFDRPRGLLADHAGNLYVLEQPRKAGRIEIPGGAVYRIAPDGTMTLIAGQKGGGERAMVDGKGAQARFVRPTFAGMAPDGTLYVYDLDDAIRKVAQDGTVTTVTALPADVGLAPDGRRYGNDEATIYRIEADGSRTVVAGQKDHDGTVLGALPGALGLNPLPTGALAATGLHTFAVISNGAVVKLVVPH